MHLRSLNQPVSEGENLRRPLVFGHRCCRSLIDRLLYVTDKVLTQHPLCAVLWASFARYVSALACWASQRRRRTVASALAALSCRSRPSSPLGAVRLQSQRERGRCEGGRQTSRVLHACPVSTFLTVFHSSASLRSLCEHLLPARVARGGGQERVSERRHARGCCSSGCPCSVFSCQAHRFARGRGDACG